MKLSSKQKKLILFAFLFGFGVAGLVYLKSYIDKKSGADQASSKITLEGKKKIYEKDGFQYRETSWKELVELDYQSGKKTDTLTQIENTLVRIPGYIVPLTDEVAILDEFLFVPNDQACIHVPPPPANLIIKAKLKTKLNFDDVFNPSWLMGHLKIVNTQSQFGAAAYQIDDAELEKYIEE